MEIKTDAVVLRSLDTGENDKMVTLLTAEMGKIGAMMKGVKKVGAKLRFAAQPFCFAEYVLAEKSGRRTVTSAALHDGFFALREDLSSFYAAAAACEICDAVSFEGMDSRSLLIDAVNALQKLTECDPAAVLVGFMLRALAFAGYPVRAENCPYCKKPLLGRMRFDLSCGAFACNECNKGVPASGITYFAVRAAQRGELCLERDGNRRALKLLSAYFTEETGARLRALDEFLRLI